MDHLLRTIRLLAHNLSNRSQADKKIPKAETPLGVIYDLYEPAQPVLATYILVYGFDLAGEKDDRLVRFASACASVGLRAIVPDLAGLKSYCFSIEDQRKIAHLADYLHSRFNSPIGIIGFSAGGSYALSVAADQRMDWIDPLLLFSPFYSLDGIPPIQQPKAIGNLSTERDWDHFIWCQFVFAYRNLDTSDFSPIERTELIRILTEYCSASSDRKRTVYQRLFRNHPHYDTSKNIWGEQNLSVFSLQGKLNQVKGRVFILHDPDDYLLPPEHSKCIMAELHQRKPSADQKLLITNLISHVTPQYRFRLADALQAVRILSYLFPG